MAQLGLCTSSGCAWQLWAARHSQGAVQPLAAQPQPRVLERATSKVADSTAFGPNPNPNPNSGLAKIQGVVSTNVTDGPNKVYVGNLPNHLKPDQVKELVEMFGELRAFHLLVDNHDIGRSKGVAFLEYMDPNNTDQVTMC